MTAVEGSPVAASSLGQGEGKARMPSASEGPLRNRLVGMGFLGILDTFLP